MNTSLLSSINLIFRSPVGSKTTAIRYAVGQTNLGQVLVGHSAHGICAIFLDDTQSGLMSQLERVATKTSLITAPVRELVSSLGSRWAPAISPSQAPSWTAWQKRPASPRAKSHLPGC
ncbi:MULTISPECIES: hypothetical protein [unclassified Pseudomonas]|uniref:hypothetical protein n=1 Tax=unclassified Pseudomonas TaxID=196821 RepID=UPI003FA2BF8C